MSQEPNPQQPQVATRPEVASARPEPKRPSLYHVVLLDDDDHTYEYVIEMLGKLFRHSNTMALKMAQEVDRSGRVIVETTTFERAEFKREQIHGFGTDWRLPRCVGSMSAVLEPAEA